MVLDVLGKWSLMDSFLMMMFTVAFRFDIDGMLNARDGEPRIPGALTVEVAPKAGFFLFLFATAWSLIMNHIILAYHRNAVSKVTRDQSRRKRSSLIATSRESISSFR